ncbi:ral guanine nucleotide dissociation stimulator-like 1 isoform X3 [Clytia hemisphaerica]|uniref:Ral guanine nucleotide dissociation stimulator-like 1 n=1 Tax=Clytia hemisphaerica TaxID=252671 RepID=A0A7M5WYC6_9CNID
MFTMRGIKKKKKFEYVRKALPWTELEEDGTLYNTLLKKVRYKSNTPQDLTQNDNNCCKQWEMVKVKQMKAGTLEKLVEHLTPVSLEVSEFDPGFFLAFLCTYKSFTTTKAVVDLLLKRFEYFETSITEPVKDREGVIRRICSVARIWIEQYPRDFDEPPEYASLNALIHFAAQRRHIPVVEKLWMLCDGKLNTLTVSPFNDERPLMFKFCSCTSVVGCTCESRNDFIDGYIDSLDIFSFPSELVAIQLTLIDAELFQRVVPRECMASFWGKRDASKGSKAQSIKLTVDQFNAVSLKVISTILNAKEKKSKEHTTNARVKAITKWLEIALELRQLKNFSSLKAVISGLQSSAIYRLPRSWELVSKSSHELYQDMQDIFSGELNNKAFRELLVMEGTSKYSTYSKSSLRRTKSKRESLMKEGVTHGTVPYLGTFLTDLMMIDTAFPNKIKDDLINFEKRRKEFEIVAQIKLLQQSAKNYRFEADQQFCTWFNSLPTYGDKDGYERSKEVEPPIPKTPSTGASTSPSPTRKHFTLKKYRSESDILVLKPEKKVSTQSEKRISTHSTNTVPADNGDTRSVTSCTSSSSGGSTSTDDDRSSTGTPTSPTNTLRKSNSVYGSIQNLFTKSTAPRAQSLHSRDTLHPEDGATQLDDMGVVARVFLEGVREVQYKSIVIKPNHRACDVISQTLEKTHSKNNVIEYSLFQIKGNRSSFHTTYDQVDKKDSFYIPMNSNMYYAIDKKFDLCFKISKKKLAKSDKRRKDFNSKFASQNKNNKEIPVFSISTT